MPTCIKCSRTLPVNEFRVYDGKPLSICLSCSNSRWMAKYYKPKECNRGLACVSPYGARQGRTNYTKVKANKDGRDNTCCYCRAYERSGTIPIPETHLKCTNGTQCLSGNGGILPKGMFSCNRSRPTGYHPLCKKCHSQQRSRLTKGSP